MSNDFTTVNLTGKETAGVLAVSEGQGNVLLINLSSTSTVYMNDSNAFDKTNPSDNVPLPPGATVVHDGTKNVYIGTQTGQSASVAVIPGGVSFFQLVSLIVKSIIINASTGNGLFVYNGTGAPGNSPIASIVAPGTTTDPFGNAVNAILNIGNLLGAHFGVDQTGNIYLADATGLTKIYMNPTLELIALYPAGIGTAPSVTFTPNASGVIDPFGFACIPGVAVYNNVLTNGVFTASVLESGQIAFFTAPTLGGGSFNWTQKISINWDQLNNQIDIAGALAIAGNLNGTTAGFTGVVSMDAGGVVSGGDLNFSSTGYETFQDNATVPGAAPANTNVYGNKSHQQVNSGDGNTYDTERLTLAGITGTISLGTPVAITASKQVAVGQYLVEGQIVYQPAGAVGGGFFSFGGSAGISGNVGWTEMTIAAAGVAGTLQAVARPGVTSNFQTTTFTAAERMCRFMGIITVGTAGTLNLTAACTIAGDDFNIQVGTLMNLYPVVAS